MASPLGRITFSGSLPSGELFNYNLHVMLTSGDAITAAQVAHAGDVFQSTVFGGATPLAALYPSSTKWSAPIGRVAPSPRTWRVPSGATPDRPRGVTGHPRPITRARKSSAARITGDRFRSG